MSHKLSDELVWRGLVNQTTLSSPAELDKAPLTFYWGVDPSAPSMTVGNLALAMLVRRFMDHGHKAILLVGGATGMIGDPDGKNEERDLKPVEEIAANKQAIIRQYQSIFSGQEFEIVDNYDWFKDLGYLQFLREIGKHVPMRQMLGREFVQRRLGEDGDGISYAEFSYSLIQGYDFLHLHENKGVSLQVAGSDQWGNSIAGVELIRRITGRQAHVWTAPLVVNKTTGVKFGKSEDGAVWLDEKMTSIYKFYQFWLNCDDEGAIDYLKIYTLLTRDAIEDIERRFNADKAGRLAQKTLAYEVTKLVHGQAQTDKIVHITDVLFGTVPFEGLNESEMAVLREELPVVKAAADPYGTIVEATLASSKSAARGFHAAGAISVNGRKIPPEEEISFKPGLNLIKRGKNSFAIVEKD